MFNKIDSNLYRYSQIYVVIQDHLEIANHYNWNYADEMISRARWGINWINNRMAFIEIMRRYDRDFEKFRAMWDINFDEKYIGESKDLIVDYRMWRSKPQFVPFILNAENNGGKLIVMAGQKDGKKYIKYTLTDSDLNILSPIEYMDWCMPNWKDKLNSNTIETTINNIDALNNIAMCMTESDLKWFRKIVELHELNN